MARLAAQGSLQEQRSGTLLVRSVIYKPALLPFKDFLKRLSRGELKKAFRSIKLRYAPSNVDDGAIKLLLKHGYVPVLVETANEGAEPLDLSSVRLTLAEGTLRSRRSPMESFPRRSRPSIRRRPPPTPTTPGPR